MLNVQPCERGPEVSVHLGERNWKLPCKKLIRQRKGSKAEIIKPRERGTRGTGLSVSRLLWKVPRNGGIKGGRKILSSS